MRNYSEFLTRVKGSILDFIPSKENLEVKLNRVIKRNNIVLDGLSIIQKDSIASISPVIYLNQYFTELQEGKTFNEILKEIANLYLINKDKKPSLNIDLSDKENIIINVINKDMNKELLEDTPHLDFLDLAVVYRYLAKEDDDGIGTILLKNNLVDETELTSLYDIALANTKRLFNVSVKTMKETIAEIMRKEGCDETLIELMSQEDGHPMYVITNEVGINGSGVILMNDVWKELANKLDSDLYILPSSIHELLAIPTFVGKSKELKEMVESVNMEQVALDERLSNNVYIYKRATNQIKICY